ncbi:hypothetical protein F66182_3167 [Fusarium sp. NRRL 66182]|nr:hypothetical protein F66182_3167 [Fusarium sp. NRRL 66182]
MPPVNLSYNGTTPTHLVSTETHRVILGISKNHATDPTQSLFSREPHMLHRRETSPGVLGVVVGLTLLATTVGVGLFLWNWSAFKRVKAHKYQKHRGKHHHRRHHSHPRHHKIAHLSTNLEQSQAEALEFTHVHQQQHHHHGFRHDPNCRHEKLHHKRDHSPHAHRRLRPTNEHRRHTREGSSDWVPRQPEPIHQIPSPGIHMHQHDVYPPNDMDAPQIHTPGWNMAHLFGHRGKKRDRTGCARHGPVGIERMR